MAEHVMRIAFRTLYAFAKRALMANSVRLTKDQQLQLQPRPKLQMYRLVSWIRFIPEIILSVY